MQPWRKSEWVRCLAVLDLRWRSMPRLSPAAPSIVKRTIAKALRRSSLSRRWGSEIRRTPIPMPNEDRQPQQRRRPAMVSDEVQRQGRLVVGVEVGPIHGDDDRAALADHLGHPGAEHVPYDDALIAEQSVDLLED